jgi:hypothetical protein
VGLCVLVQRSLSLAALALTILTSALLGIRMGSPQEA